MPINRNNRIMTIISILLILATGLFNLFTSENDILSFVYMAIYFEWLYSVRRRFLQRSLRRLMTIFAMLIILWSLLRFIKYHLTVQLSFLNRQLWYWYYVPLMLLPIIMFWATLYFGKADMSEVSKKWKLVAIPYILAMLGILTNDLHQWAFKLEPNIENWNGSYSYGFLYFVSFALNVAAGIAVFFVAFKLCVKKQFRKYLWMPLSVIAFGIIYWVEFIKGLSGEKGILQTMFEMPEAISLLLIAYFESFAATHIIPSNTNHQSFFSASSINAGLTDNEYSIQLKASNGTEPSAEQIQFADKDSVILNDGNTLLKSRRVKGGYFYWNEDVRELNHLNRELIDTKDYLLEEQAILDASNALEESRKTTAEQNRLYDEIDKRIKPQLETLDDLMNHLPEEEEAFRHTMKYASVINAYIKRYSNLILLSGTNNNIKSEELGMAISESMEYIKLLNVVCHLEIRENGLIPSKQALSAYELFEKAIEAALPTADAVFAVLNIDKQEMSLYLEIAHPNRLLIDDRAEINTEDNVEFIRFKALTGGEKI